jgi:hypothetical protein
MKKNIHPLKQKRREDRRLEKLGSDNPFCLYCGFSMPMVLRPVTREFLERHHLLGIATDRGLTLALCFNCHALAEEDLLGAGVSKSKKRDSNPVRLARNICTRLALHHQQISQSCWRMMHLLKDRQRNWNLIGFMFEKVWPVWKACNGKIPKRVLRQLEKDGDWPSGSAAAIMKRISRDENLRFQLESL